MLFEILITDKVYQDLDSILGYIARDNPARAESYVDELLGKIRTLKTMPKRCPLSAESMRYGFDIRHLVHGRYRILFTIKNKQVFVLRVMHSARLWNAED